MFWLFRDTIEADGEWKIRAKKKLFLYFFLLLSLFRKLKFSKQLRLLRDDVYEIIFAFSYCFK